jgi:hypothetical protein
MRVTLFTFIALILSLAFGGCKKETASIVATNPNIINGCEIIQSQVVQTDLNSGQIHSYINTYQYDSLIRLIAIGNGQNNDTDHYHYQGHDCDGDHNSIWHNSPQGFVLSSIDGAGSYQYSYDGGGYMQLEIYTDTLQRHNDSYTRSYYWDINGNLSYTVKQCRSQPTPVTTTYSYYTDKPNQELIPSSWQAGRTSANLIRQAVVSSNGAVISTDSYTYIFDAQGKVAQYTDLTVGEKQTVYTLAYSCH